MESDRKGDVVLISTDRVSILAINRQTGTSRNVESASCIDVLSSLSHIFLGSLNFLSWVLLFSFQLQGSFLCESIPHTFEEKPEASAGTVNQRSACETNELNLKNFRKCCNQLKIQEALVFCTQLHVYVLIPFHGANTGCEQILHFDLFCLGKTSCK